MNPLQRFSTIFAASFAATLGTSGFAAAPPAIVDLVSDSGPYDRAQLDRMKVFVGDYCRDLNSPDLTKVPVARAKLLEPLRSSPGGPTNYFRLQYGKLVVPQLPKNGQATPIALANALQVAGFLATDDSARFIAGHFAAGNQPNEGLRIMAANCFRVALMQESLSQDEINRNLRELGRAGEAETNGLALRRQFEALAANDGPVSLQVQIALLQKTAERVAGFDKPSDLLTEAAYPAVFSLRQQFLRFDGSSRTALARDMGPALLAVLQVGDKQWDIVHADDQAKAKAAYGKVLELAEGTLTLGARELGAAGVPVGGLKRVWDAGDADAYRRRLEQWRQILNRPPFAGR